jgi:cell division protein FtsB
MRAVGSKLPVGVAALIVGLSFVFNAQAQTGEQVSAKTLEQDLEAQLARNEALRQHIAKLEAVLEKGVCDNPEAAALVQKSRELKASPPQ